MNVYTSSKGTQRRFRPQNILYLTGSINYCHIYLTTGEVVLMSRTLKHYESVWPSFIRVHKRILINPMYAISICLAPRIRDHSHVIMANKAVLTIARRRLQLVQQALEPFQLTYYASETTPSKFSTGVIAHL